MSSSHRESVENETKRANVGNQKYTWQQWHSVVEKCLSLGLPLIKFGNEVICGMPHSETVKVVNDNSWKRGRSLMTEESILNDHWVLFTFLGSSFLFGLCLQIGLRTSTFEWLDLNRNFLDVSFTFLSSIGTILKKTIKFITICFHPFCSSDTSIIPFCPFLESPDVGVSQTIDTMSVRSSDGLTLHSIPFEIPTNHLLVSSDFLSGAHKCSFFLMKNKRGNEIDSEKTFWILRVSSKVLNSKISVSDETAPKSDQFTDRLDRIQPKTLI
jgi:hypothetical protein